MGQPWAVGRTEGAPGRLPLVLTALWAAAVGLELAYVLVLGPGPPPLGPLARALQLALAAFQLLNLLGNVGLFLRSDPSIRGVMLAGRGLGQGWAYCYQCQSQVPPRSGHCSACRICILRRDHHCRLLGRCVGFRNYRPFLCLLLHASGVLLHVSVLLGPALAALLQSHTPLHTATLLLLPWLMLLTGRVSLAQFALAFVTDTCVAGFGISLSSFASKSPFEIVSGAHRAYRSFWGKATSTRNRVFQLIPFWSDSRHRMASSLLSLLRCILWLRMWSPLVNAPRERQKRGYHAAVEAVYRRDMQLADGAGLTCVLTKTP
ncbi:probable palmitoyltransferase ZDHHC24 isoform X1 [Desmodus rotundus]|uniref:probable palmitoyltransferase ZDHHC24 isoform X1 n=1 Tax=Desmodus rotundus TaxID=9430 RepID=UPI00238104A0|nr:probable palmitoyltransferase ZDHHC24 isoform X1 [Desmodus rotundus]